ncbi:hypothetical protein MIMGU_mgv1a017029mg [Erythranthe guttata]|uniref:Uncharacterized protein n=1 Tax=Erythranthe guttata TaxID=4155 RepID=A0A022QC74_ERYGU|nr:hypothetical protein MIMGU_mgv1a017029mg [Erythranthe guttata]
MTDLGKAAAVGEYRGVEYTVSPPYVKSAGNQSNGGNGGESNSSSQVYITGGMSDAATSGGTPYQPIVETYKSVRDEPYWSCGFPEKEGTQVGRFVG